MEWVLCAVLLLVLVAEPWRGARLYRRFAAAAPEARPRHLVRWILSGWALGIVAVLYAASTGKLGRVLPLRFHLAPFASGLVESGFSLWPVLIGVALGSGISVGLGVSRRKKGQRRVRTLGEFSALIPRNAEERWLCLGLALTAGICEELVFRGALLHIVERVLPGASLVLAASIAVVLFGAAHAYQGVKGVIGTTVLGGILMAVFVGSGSLLPAIALHAAIDLKLVFMRAPDAVVSPGTAQLEH